MAQIHPRLIKIFRIGKMEQINGQDPFSELEKWSKSTVEIHFWSWKNREDPFSMEQIDGRDPFLELEE
jgi:hypothetical protein